MLLLLLLLLSVIACGGCHAAGGAFDVEGVTEAGSAPTASSMARFVQVVLSVEEPVGTRCGS